MDERQTPRSSRSSKSNGQRNLITFAVIAVVLLLIGGFIGSSIQRSHKSAELEKANSLVEEKLQEIDELNTKISTLEGQIAEKQNEIDDLRKGVVSDGVSDRSNADGEDEDEDRGGGSWFGTFIIIFIIVALIIAAIYICFNVLKKRNAEDGDDDDDDDDDYDDYDDYDDDDDLEDEDEE